MSILELLRNGDFAAAHNELANLGCECMKDPNDYSLHAAYADLQACAAYYAKKARIALVASLIVIGCGGQPFADAVEDSGVQSVSTGGSIETGGASSTTSSPVGGAKLTSSEPAHVTGGASGVNPSACPCPGPCQTVDGSGLRCAYASEAMPSSCTININFPCSGVSDHDAGQVVCYTCTR